MGRITVQRVFLIGVLLLVAFLAMGCGNADSRDTTNQSGMTDAQASGEHRQQVTLHITGMS